MAGDTCRSGAAPRRAEPGSVAQSPPDGEGTVAGHSDLHDVDDLAVVLAHERDEAGPRGHQGAGPAQPLVEALLDRRAGDGPAAIAEAADRLLRRAAPWVLDSDAAILALLQAAGDAPSRALYTAWSSWRPPRAVGELAAELGVSGQLAGRMVRRVDSKVRAALATSALPAAWIVANLRRRLGPVATEAEVHEALRSLGVTGAAGDLALWLAGPYRAIPGLAGWLALEANTIVARTSSCLAADGGVRRLVDVEAELEMASARLAPWLHACGAAVIHDVAISLAGSLAGVVERVLDAHGCPQAATQIAACLAGGGRDVAGTDLQRTLRSRKFIRSAAGDVGLADWEGDQLRSGDGRRSKRRQGPNSQPGKPRQPGRSSAMVRSPATTPPATTPEAPRPTASTPHATTHEVVEAPHGDGRLWLWVRVDAEVLRGAEAVVPSVLVEGLGVASPARRTFSSRYGPIVLAHDGPQPVRGSVRAVALAAGARDGDTLLLGFSACGDVAVEVRHTTVHSTASGGAATSSPFSNFVTGGTP